MEITKYLHFIPWILVGLIVVSSLKGIKVNKEENTLIREWNTKDKWQGEVTAASIIDWKQLNVMRNFDYFYLFTLESNIGGKKTVLKAAGVIPVSQAKLIKNGASVVVKYSIQPKKTAVEYIVDPEGQHHVELP
ncbi:hypothetical protein [Kosakonia cowanii]|jgi:hypothetical protein|uniref:hypothetical protein n=1 Tax=Kosakonia cowanii TaxID=208223 RepID=UPI0028A848E3|nr:hypothetical protein [Kosakonia cowanii]